MGVRKRVKQLAKLVGILVLLAGLAGVAVAAYLWWEGRGQTELADYSGGSVGAEREADEVAASTAGGESSESA